MLNLCVLLLFLSRYYVTLNLMCGITGIFSFEKDINEYSKHLQNSIECLQHRGPDFVGTYKKDKIGIGHSRLAIVDLSSAGNQPFVDQSGRYILAFNGQFYNYKKYRKELEKDGINFLSDSDTEVLIYLLIKYRNDAFDKINGCFSIAFYDSVEEELILARDRMGIKPLLYYYDEDKCIFASELKAIFKFGISKEIDYSALFSYFQLNYIPENQCIISKVSKVQPGTFMVFSKKGVSTKKYYEIPYKENPGYFLDYQNAEKKLVLLLEDAVKSRMAADVEVGCFLSGGIDSSIITALAARNTDNLKTFSLGFKDKDFFDETEFADIVAKKFKTDHTVLKISDYELFEKIYDIIDFFDEPFADSSAIAMNFLSKMTKRSVSVALSGDGADEMFAGYNKHKAHFRANNPGIKEKIITALNPVWEKMPKSRSGTFGNLFRQFYKYSEGSKLDPALRYWNWASIADESYAGELIKQEFDYNKYLKSKYFYLNNKNFKDINAILHADMNLVLQGDMLTKVDSMSMANSLEVRTPFLDHNVVDFVFNLPVSYKIDKFGRKKILKDSFRNILPTELLNRRKMGFEVPLLSWLKNQLWSDIDNIFLSEKFIKDQNVFNYSVINDLKMRLHSKNPDDSHAKIWALLVFQRWWQKHIN